MFGKYKQGTEKKGYHFELYMEDTTSIRGKVYIPWNKTHSAESSGDSPGGGKRELHAVEYAFPAITKDDFFQMYRGETDTDFGGRF